MTEDPGTTATGKGGDTGASAVAIPSQVIVLTTGSGKAHRVHKDRIVIGTVVSSDVRLTGDGVATLHAVIEQTPAGAMIYDLASDTGVFVNGTKVVTQPLKSGDEITLGVIRLKFALEDLKALGAPKQAVRESAEGQRLFLNPQEDTAALLLVDESEVEEIFDYRPTSKSALEVVMSWASTILDVEHFVKARQVTVGQNRRSHFGIPPILSAKEYAIVIRRGDGFVLNVDQKMRGVIQRDGTLQSLDQVRAAKGGSGTLQIPLGKNDFAKISVGEVDFYFSYTAAPPRLKSRRLMERDAFMLRIFMGSVGLTLAVVATLLSIEVPKTLEAEELPERIATILYQPERFSQIPKPKAPPSENKPVEAKPVQPKPPKVTKLDIKPKPVKELKPVPKEMNVAPKPVVAKNAGKSPGQNQAKEGEGARAKGQEGIRGSKTGAKFPEHQNAAKRPSPEGGQGAGGGKSQVPGAGNVDLLKGASDKIQNLLGNVGATLGKGGSKLEGFGGFTSQGGGGLALSGTGKGGGGDAETTLGGLGDKGLGGGRVGTGLGAAGTGNGIVGGKARVVIRSGGPEEAVVMGAIDADAVEAALLAHKDEFRLCYEREINAENPNLAGRVGTNFVIGSSGRVNQAAVESTTLKHAAVEACILKVIKRIQFPIPRGGGVVQVTYPFKFSPVNR